MRKIPTSEELENYYAVFDYEKEKEIPSLTRLSLENRLDQFEKYRQNNRMLDVGCGEGWMLELAMQRGWQVCGTEFSPRAIEICKNKGIKMYSGILHPENMGEKDFDVIISSETIEHINNPREEVLNIHQLLRKGGLFFVTTPNFNSYLRLIFRDKYDIIRYPGHLAYYTKKTLKKLLSESGFKKVELQTTGMSFSHYQVSKRKDDKSFEINYKADEELRNKIAASSLLKLVKKIINAGLSFSGIGMTLKAFYTKK
ncbi:MAG TPA: class I SAM-dependent methyltransferase [Chitinophagaceae bacterium]|nr:class I SAM-dependent methyltransferase [Chitinophagaceae bacterium]